MKLKVKNLDWLAGRPVVILNDRACKKLNVFVNDRVAVKNAKKVYAVVDIFPQLVETDEIGLCRELSKILKLKNGSFVDVSSSEISRASFLISKKINGERLNEKELNYIISEIVNNNLTEAEIAYFTAAEKLNGMSMDEVIGLTKAMVETGERLRLQGQLIADKHCIGGIAGNRTTPIVISICACVGLILPKTSSRAITSASGTADVIETIANVELSSKEIKKTIKKTNACLAWGGSLKLAPSDEKIIRVERILNLDVEAQLLASIMSKKISSGSKYVLIDIPYGEKSKIKNIGEAKKLGDKFLQIARHFRVKLKCVYTDGSEPIGNGFGPILELKDILKVLKNEPDAPFDLKEKGIYLSSELMKLCGIKDAEKKAREILETGKAYEKFKEILNSQNNDDDLEERIASLKLGQFRKTIYAKKSGKIISINNIGINSLCRILGTPETKGAGVYLYKHTGEIKRGGEILTLYSESKSKMKEGIEFFKREKVIEVG